MLIEGKLKLDRWEKDGQKFQRLRVVGERMQMLGRRGEGGGQQNNQTSRPTPSRQEEQDAPFMDDGPGGSDIPF